MTWSIDLPAGWSRFRIDKRTPSPLVECNPKMQEHNALHRILPKCQVKKALTGLVLSQVLLLNACDPFTGGSLLLDCIDDDGPVLTPRDLPIPILNHSYEAVITASIENEPYDDRFQYKFNIGAGLPAGLIVDTFEREVRISGAPTELGNYAMRVEVTVEDASSDGNSSRLCRRKTARNYVFMIQQGL